jgi:hypothetical protein
MAEVNATAGPTVVWAYRRTGKFAFHMLTGAVEPMRAPQACRSLQEVDEVPVQLHDRRLDAVVTEHGCHRC